MPTPTFDDLSEEDRLIKQDEAIDGATRSADAAVKFSFTAFLSTALMSMFGIGNMTIPFFAIPFLILGKLFEGIMDGIISIHKRNLNASNLMTMGFGMVLGVIPMLIIMMSMTVIGEAALIAQLISLGSVFFGISSVFHFGGAVSNLFKALMAPPNSNERKAYLQSAFKHTVNLFISAALFSLLVFSFAPPVAIGLMAAVSIVSSLYIAWSFFPNFRKGVKRLFGLAQSDNAFEYTPSLDKTSDVVPTKTLQDTKIEKAHFGHLFKRAYRRDVVKHYLLQAKTNLAKNYLIEQIEQFRLKYKKEFPSINPAQLPQKQREKLAVLAKAEALLNSIPAETKKPSSKKEAALQSDLMSAGYKELNSLLEKDTVQPQHTDASGADKTRLQQLKEFVEKNRLCEQSFFADISDTMDIVEAVEYYLCHEDSPRHQPHQDAIAP